MQKTGLFGHPDHVANLIRADRGIDENMRTKIRHLGLPLSRRTFVCLDHLLHTVPPALLVSHLVRRRKRVPLLNIVYVSRACAERSEGGKGLNVAYGHR